MIPAKPKFIVDIGRVLVVLVLLLMPLAVNAQVGPAMRSAPSLHVFGTYTYGSSDWSSNHSEGYSLGGFFQTTYLWGLETRGAYLHWGSNEFRYDALAGPRIAFHFARFSPYGAVVAGLGHPVVRKNALPASHYHSGTGAEWKLLGGVDFYAGHRFSIRLGEISYAEVYALPQGVTSLDFSSGVVYRLPVWGH